MNDLEFKEKYLKYKNKYIQLKSLQNQKGAFAYLPGQYIFFITDDKKEVADTAIKNNKISSLDRFTTDIGNCSRFLRIKKLKVPDLKHDYDTIYTNQSSIDVAKRVSTDAVNTTVDTLNATSTVVNNAVTAVDKKVRDVYNDAIQKGGVECDKLPIPLKDISDNIPFIDNVNISKENILTLINGINKNQPSKIGKVIVLEKTGYIIGRVNVYYNYNINYNNNNEAIEANLV